ncbi:unnamed protein product, partial [Mesorhabditis spiculigera]
MPRCTSKSENSAITIGDGDAAPVHARTELLEPLVTGAVSNVKEKFKCDKGDLVLVSSMVIILLFLLAGVILAVSSDLVDCHGAKARGESIEGKNCLS